MKSGFKIKSIILAVSAILLLSVFESNAQSRPDVREVSVNLSVWNKEHEKQNGND